MARRNDVEGKTVVKLRGKHMVNNVCLPLNVCLDVRAICGLVDPPGLSSLSVSDLMA